MFLLGVVETAIGAGLAFALGLIAFHYQSRAQREEDQKAARDIANDALFRTLQSAMLNIETLANVKMQIVADLRRESRSMEALVERYYAEKGGERRAAVFKDMRQASESFHSFYKTTPSPSALEPPAFDELSLVVREMPALTTFLHRGTSTLHDVIDRIDDRNTLISEHAAENNAGMTEHRFVYYMSMLTGLANVICESVDDALAFFILVKKQAENYLSRSTLDGKYAAYEIAENALPHLPDEDRFPSLKAQIKEFD